jgi:hypothetical protein
MPVSIRRFEFAMYVFIAASFAILALTYAGLGRAVTAVPLWFILIPLAQLVAVAGLIYLVARRRQGWARWIILAVFLYSAWEYLEHAQVFSHFLFSGSLWFLPSQILLAFAVATVQFLAPIVALYYAFSAESRAWLKVGR